MENFRDISWKLIDKYFADNPYNLVDHHLSSFDAFFNTGIVSIFRENNPIRFIEPENKDDPSATRNECLIYLGGKDGSKLYFGKPIIYDDMSADKKAHYMYPNDARLRNMTYGITVHFDVVTESIYYVGDERKTHTYTNRAYLGRFPLMTQSNMCILRNLTPEVRFNMGECRNDFGGYFIIDGKEKSIVPQEKFADNIINIKKNKIDANIYSHSADIRSVSEDPSKPIRTTSVKIVAPTTVLSNNQLVVMIPNVKKPIPLFILMRALGIVSDKNIIEYCLLDLNKNANYIDLFIPCIHDANKVFNQQTALEYIALFTKYGTITYVHNILMNFFLPHIGEDNYLDKAYFVGYMVNKLIRVFMKDEKPTDRDNFRYKRIETDGSLLYDLFREYYLIQRRDIALKVDSEYYFHVGQYKNEDFVDLISVNFHTFFKEKIIETGFKKAFKGNWGATGKTKRVGIVQDMNRLSWFTFISQLRKINLDLDASAKVTGPRLLNSSQWGYIDPIDTPDGGNIGLHKHLAISTHITSGFSCIPLIKWLRSKTPIRLLQECYPELLASLSKVFVNGIWIGSVENPLEMIESIKLFRRNGLIPIYTSISFNYENNEIFIYTDAGRLTRPIYYLFDNKLKGGTSEESTSSSISSSISSISSSSSSKKKQFNIAKEISINRPDVLKKMSSVTWEQVVSGFKKEGDDFNYKKNMIYDLFKFYPNIDSLSKLLIELEKDKSLIDFVDPSEEEGLMIATSLDDVKKSKFYTHVEIEPSLMFGVMGNQICYPENNPVTRNAFSCGQSKQAVSVYHSNYQMRMDKMGVILNYGQIPLVKSKYTEYLNNEEQPYGINGIVAIMSYTGYNVEDAILINEGSIKRGMFNTTYFTMYETREESSKMGDSTTNAVFADVMKKEVSGLKEGYDYSYLDKYGLVKENTALNEKIVIIGKVSSNSESTRISDASVFTKKGQLGFVDKSFITEGEEGFRLAKIRVREERIPSIGDKMACTLPTQQVLTNFGWVQMIDIDIKKHKLATLDTDGNMCYEFPKNYFVYDYTGPMHSMKNKQVEFVVTPNHNMYVKKRDKKDYQFIQSKDMFGKMVRFKKNMKNDYPDEPTIIFDGKEYDMDTWLQLLGMFISDGSTNATTVYLSCFKERKIAFNTMILDNLGLKYRHNTKNGCFSFNQGDYPVIFEHLDSLSVGAFNKKLPDYVWNLSERQSRILMEALLQGNGHTYKDGFSRYGTISHQLADDISRLCLHCGWSGNIKLANSEEDIGNVSRYITNKNGIKKPIITRHLYYKISIIRKQNEPWVNKKVNESNEEKWIDYSGKVYCVELPSSNLYYSRESFFSAPIMIGNSRTGQKGTVGLIIPEEDMPFTEDGIRPDLIINPHALPSRMTIGQLIELILGKVCASYGGFGDCTAFANKGPNAEVYGSALMKAGFHSSGNQIMYNGMNGEQLFSDIYIGPTYYMRLKHMVKDKINFRARGPNAMLTRQPIGGRANDGGLAIGSMERDGVIAHGAMGFLTESFLDRADDYSMAICNKTGCIAIYNETLNLFISPFADGPLRFKGTVDGKINIENVSKFGRSFSIVRIPYTLKLMIQELQVMNIQMRIITEDNIDQLISMSYSNNINKVLNDSSDLDTLFKTYKATLQEKLRKERDNVLKNMIVKPKVDVPEPETESEEIKETPSPDYAPFSPAYASPEIPDELKNLEQQIEKSPLYDPNSPFDYKKEIDKIKNPKIKSDFEALSDRDQKLLMKMLSEKRMKDQKKIDKFKNMEKISILETDENKPKLEDIQEGTEPDEGATSISDLKPLDVTSDAGKVKVITIKE